MRWRRFGRCRNAPAKPAPWVSASAASSPGSRRCAIGWMFAVSFYGVGIEETLDEADGLSCPLLLHFAGADGFVPPEAVTAIEERLGGRKDVEVHVYPGVDHAFYNRDRADAYHRPSAMMAHSRTVAALRSAMGPDYDLEALWEDHLDCEFRTRDTAATMKTMVPEPYVNHVPTMTGGYRGGGPGQVLCAPFHPENAEGHHAHPDLPHRGRRPGGGRDALQLHP